MEECYTVVMKVRAKDPSVVEATKLRVNGMIRLHGEWKPLRDLGIECLSTVSDAVLERVMVPKSFPATKTSQRLFYYDLSEPSKSAVAHFMQVHGVVEPPMSLRLVMGEIEVDVLKKYLGRIAKQQGYKDFDDYHMWYLENVLIKDKGRGVPEGSKEVWPVVLSEFADEGLQDGQHRFHQYVEYGFETIPYVAFYDEVALIYGLYKEWKESIFIASS